MKFHVLNNVYWSSLFFISIYSCNQARIDIKAERWVSFYVASGLTFVEIDAVL